MEQNQEQQPRIQIYSTSKAEVSPFWREKYEKDAKKYWDVFYKRHQDKFFKDRHYLEKEWGHYFAGLGRKVILEVGCGAGNTIFPLIATYPDIFIHACDFSPRAVNLVKPNGYVLFRDYATGDLAQERFTCKDQKISENFYVRGDGTRAFYFSDDFLTSLFQENGFHIIEHGVCCKQVENRAQGIVMNRRWVQAVFRLESADSLSSKKSSTLKTDIIDNTLNDSGNGFEVDMSDGLAVEMFGLSPCSNEIIEIQLRDWSFKIKVLSKEYQHTCKSTGLMLWESAQLMASVLAANQDLVAGKRVLELGCGCGGICSMVAARSAELVVATDGDANALDLLTENVASNIHFPSLAKLTTKKLEWGNQDDIEAVKKLNDKGFDVIIGTDVAYVPEAISPLFATARELITSDGNIEEDRAPALILCHVLHRVDEPSILSAASQFGFKLVDRWPTESATSPTQIIISTWFLDHTLKDYIPSTALSILYFQLSIAYAQI